jgi:hypothetical protein
MIHEVFVDLFKTRPSLAAELLVEVLGLSLPAYTEARLASIDLTEVAPAEYRADVVVVLLSGAAPVRAIIVEVQLAPDPRKRGSWPAYVAVAHARHGCLVDLLVLAPDPAVATWCATPIPLGPVGFVLTPQVLRREAVPVVTDPTEAARRLELGMLSALAHGQGEQGGTIASALLPAIAGLDEERARFYFDLLVNSVNKAARRALEAKMKGYVYQSEFAKKYVAQGEAAAYARALLTVLRVRGVAVPDAARERILAEKDPARLERWHEKATLAASIADVIDDPS